jgi:hypothetical protein
MRTFQIDTAWADLLTALGEPHLLDQGVIWQNYGGIVEPLGPPDQQVSGHVSEVRHVISALGGRLARWSSSISQPESPWYAIVCDHPLDIDSMSGKSMRKQIRRSLNQLEIRRLEPREQEDMTYPVYIAAHAAYRGFVPELADEASFRRRMALYSDVPQLVHVWGALLEGRLIAYRLFYVYAGVEVAAQVAKQDPEFRKYNPFYGMLYESSRHYLGEAGIPLMSSGYRSLLHETGWQDMLQEKFEYRRRPLKLSILYPAFTSLAMKVSRPFANILSQMNPKLRALYQHDQFSRQSTSR